MTDGELLQKYVLDRDEEAFAQIVHRHIDMVYAAATRQLPNSSNVDDVAQAVFIVLAKKAAKVNGNTIAGWLVNAARLLAKQSIREDWRRKQREEKAAAMKPETSSPQDWPKVAPLVDEALSRLGPGDRTAVTLRYLEGRAVGEVAAAMGVTEAAAAKRLSRAIAKLRKLFSRRGVEMQSLAIGELLLSHARSTAPADLAPKSVAVAMGNGAAATATALAHGILGSAALAGSAAWTYATAAVVVASIGLAGYGTVKHIENKKAAALAQQQLAEEALNAAKIIHVGIMLSQFTATGPHYTQVPYGYKDSYLELYRALRTESNIETVPLIEPGSDDPDLMATLKAEFKGKTPIIVNTRDDLMKLDVIACARVWNETPQVLAAMNAAAHDGKGLLVIAGIGLNSPGLGQPPVDELNGLKEGAWEYCSTGADSHAVQSHPLLGTLKPQDALSLPANGECGILADGATGLIEVDSLDDVHPVQANHPILAEYHFYPLIAGRLGKGRIVNCQFTSWEPIRDELQKPTDNRFMVHCVEWLANHKLD